MEIEGLGTSLDTGQGIIYDILIGKTVVLIRVQGSGAISRFEVPSAIFEGDEKQIKDLCSYADFRVGWSQNNKNGDEVIHLYLAHDMFGYNINLTCPEYSEWGFVPEGGHRKVGDTCETCCGTS